MKKLGYARDYGEELSRAVIIVKQRTIFELNRAHPETASKSSKGHKQLAVIADEGRNSV
jgi:hypothetical protein